MQQYQFFLLERVMQRISSCKFHGRAHITFSNKTKQSQTRYLSTVAKDNSVENEITPKAKMPLQTLLEFDQKHMWHPYTSLTNPIPVYPIASAHGNKLYLEESNKALIDGMSSWWCAIHGYNHPKLNQAIQAQLEKMSHVMFGGLTHRPAMELCHALIEMTPPLLQNVFLCDSGSVSVEVAMKMALQYQMAKQQTQGHQHTLPKTKFISLRKGYHGDTSGAMSVCDPETGMHHMFQSMLAQQIFIPPPISRFDAHELDPEDEMNLNQVFQKYHSEVAAFILEPIVQGAGGMRIYSPAYLKYVRQKCDEYEILFIADEIATGFGRTGELFACHHANVQPDLLCLGKGLTGGMMTMAATLSTQAVAETICNGTPGVFMHGPTFMGNPLAASVALASLELLDETDWQSMVKKIETILMQELMPLIEHDRVLDVRILGAIGVVECNEKVHVPNIQKYFVGQGVWIRPFHKTIYIMPPYITNMEDLKVICSSIAGSLDDASHFE